MPDSFRTRLAHAWNVFVNGESDRSYTTDLGPTSSYRPDRIRFRIGNERSIVNSVYNRIALDVASIPMQHVRLDQNGRFLETMASGLNTCLTLEANIDQTPRAFIQDVVMSMCGEGCVAIVPVETTLNPNVTGSYDIVSMRTAKIVQWMPEHVRVELYNQRTGQKQEIPLSKKFVAIIENPFYATMNELNSTLQRLIYKLNLLDVVDEQSSSGKLDIIVQVPYTIKTDARKQLAERRKQELESQLKDSKYGIAYTDATEKITQLNRPAENNLLKQVEYLSAMLYGQLGLTQAVVDGTADEKEMLNYYSRTIEPFCAAITDAMKRSFITKTARSQGQSIIALRDPFKLVPISEIGPLADSLTRNAVLTSNEMRSVIGFKPSDEKDADSLRNKNLNASDSSTPDQPVQDNSLESQNGRSTNA